MMTSNEEAVCVALVLFAIALFALAGILWRDGR
jgi:hypothetical protein